MKKLLSAGQVTPATDKALLIARIGIALLMLTHGIPKLVMLFSGAPVQFPSISGLSAAVSLGVAGFTEVFCSVLLLAGFATRLVVIPLIMTMLVAVLFFHAADPFTVKEPAVLYLLVYVVLLITGAGKYSLDYLFKNKKATVGYKVSTIEDPTLAIYQ